MKAFRPRIFIAGEDEHVSNVSRRLAQDFAMHVRSPHRTTSKLALQGELALAACGVLVLDEVNEIESCALRPLLNTWAMMSTQARPWLVVGFTSDRPEWSHTVRDWLWTTMLGAEKNDRARATP